MNTIASVIDSPSAVTIACTVPSVGLALLVDELAQGAAIDARSARQIKQGPAAQDARSFDGLDVPPSTGSLGVIARLHLSSGPGAA
jgi:hypothetical protein